MIIVLFFEADSRSIRHYIIIEEREFNQRVWRINENNGNQLIVSENPESPEKYNFEYLAK